MHRTPTRSKDRGRDGEHPAGQPEELRSVIARRPGQSRLPHRAGGHATRDGKPRRYSEPSAAQSDSSTAGVAELVAAVTRVAPPRLVKCDEHITVPHTTHWHRGLATEV